MTFMANRKWTIAGWLVLAAAGCGHGPRHVTDEDPGDKIPAIEAAAKAHDQRAIPQLVRDLASDDSAVRFYAIDALHRLTGKTLGYRYYDDDEKRKPALLRWREWERGHSN